MDVGGLLGNEAIRARLDAAAAQDRFSHSYLICGPDGSGKHTLAKILAAAMQCTGAGRKPCGRCEGCRKVFEGVHPDVITVNDPAHKTIAVDVIRQMRADVFLRPNEGKRKIYLIEQDMAEPPQNALLKILEEPPAYAAFLILSDRAEKLLPTIRSRCAELHLAPAPQTEGWRFCAGSIRIARSRNWNGPFAARAAIWGRRYSCSPARDRPRRRRSLPRATRREMRWRCWSCCCRWKSGSASS